MFKTVFGCFLAAVAAFLFMGLQTGLIAVSKPSRDDDESEGKSVAVKKAASARGKFPEDLAPAARAQPVAAAAEFKVANKPHKIAFLKVSGAMHDWQKISIDYNEDWTATNVEETELVVIVSKQTQTMVERAHFVNGPPIDRNRFELEASVVEAKTGKVLGNRTFVNMPRAVMPREQYETTAIGTPVHYKTVFNWIANQSRGGFTASPNSSPLITVVD